MRKFKIGLSFYLLIIMAIMSNSVVLFINYILALLMHELAHMLVAVNKGYKLKELRLDIFGLSLALADKLDERDNFAINIAGPLCNLLLAILCMAMYWIMPVSYRYLNDFCVSNLALAFFNILPIYPLDGGKIMSGIFSSYKQYSRVDCLVRVLLTFFSLGLFVLSIFYTVNWYFLLLTVFFMSARKKSPTLSIIKYSKRKHIEKVVMYKVTGEEMLFDLLKKLSNNRYTIFFLRNGKTHYIDEDSIINLSTKNSLKTKIKDLY